MSLSLSLWGRESINQMAGVELPEDVVRVILSMLPVKSLLRFRCVCKLWCTLIANPSFIAQHLNRSFLRKSDNLFVNRRFQYSDENFMPTHSDIEALVDISTYLDVPFFNILSSIQLLGPSNGLICLTNIRNHIVLCNPATRKFKKLPIPNFSYPDHLSLMVDGVGFGFDPKTSDYKVVQHVELFEHCPLTGFDSYRTQVYSLSSNSWRQIEEGTDVNQWRCSGPLFNGAFHWYPLYGDFYETIIAFHMSDEVFHRIPLPRVFSCLDGHCRSLTVLNDCLSLIRYENSNPWYAHVDKHFDVWVMKEYGVQESWTRFCKIGPLLGICRPLVFWKDSELLLENCEGQLVSCNLYDQNVKCFQVDGVARTLGVVMYSESLVSI